MTLHTHSTHGAGMFTSPHLVDIRERIRINGQMLSEAAFAAAFWRVWDALHAGVVC